MTKAADPAEARQRRSFVTTPQVRDLTERALGFLDAGYPVHLRGPAGAGKTTLAFHVAAQLGRPITLITGDDEFGSSDLIGGETGSSSKRVIDRYVHSVVKIEEDVSPRWIDQRLTTACLEGHTLVYDEFTRSRATANNVLLSVFEERLLVLPVNHRQRGYVRVHPRFRAILTSNSREYVGVHQAQDALQDRLVTIDVAGYDRITETAITVARSGVDVATALAIVDVVRAFRASPGAEQTPTIRAALMIARVARLREARASPEDPWFAQICRDVLRAKIGPGPSRDAHVAELDLVIERRLRFGPASSDEV